MTPKFISLAEFLRNHGFAGRVRDFVEEAGMNVGSGLELVCSSRWYSTVLSRLPANVSENKLGIIHVGFNVSCRFLSHCIIRVLEL